VQKSEQEMQKSYYAIIPANVRYDKNLPPNAKLLYGEITALSNEKGYCWASNTYFSKLYGTSKVTVSRWIKALSDGGYITTKLVYKQGTKEIESRHIWITPTIPEGINKNDNTYYQKVNDPINKNVNTPINKNVKDNNTIINNTNNNTNNKKTFSLQIKNLRQRYSTKQLKVIDEYLDMIRHTRVSGKISDSVILKMYESWDRYPSICVEYGLYVHTSKVEYHSKRENYTLGIIRGTTADEAVNKLKQIRPTEGNEQSGETDYFSDKEFDE